MVDRPTVLITDYEYPNVEAERAVFEAAGIRMLTAQAKTPEEVIAAAQEADALLCQYAVIPAQVIEALPRLRAIVRYGIGVDTIDLEAARKRGIPVANVPTYGINEVADHTMTLALAVLRKLPEVRDQVRRGQWDGAPCRPIHELRGRTFGLVGFGRIGRAVAERAHGFGFRLAAHDPFLAAESIASEGVAPLSWKHLLVEADVLSLHLPLTDETHHVLNVHAIALMRDGAVLINCSRGGLVDTDALVGALRSGKLAGAGLDVVEGEPIGAEHPLLKLDNAIVTSHCAWYSEEAMQRLQRMAAEEVARALVGERMLNVVNGL